VMGAFDRDYAFGVDEAHAIRRSAGYVHGHRARGWLRRDAQLHRPPRRSTARRRSSAASPTHFGAAARRVSECRRRRRATHGSGCGGYAWRRDEAPAAHARRLRAACNLPACSSWAWAARRTRSAHCSAPRTSPMLPAPVQHPGRLGSAKTIARRRHRSRDAAAARERRRPRTVPASHITGPPVRRIRYSGITANPALGAAVDLLVRHGGRRSCRRRRDLRCRAPAYSTRRVARDRRETDRADQVVGGLHRAREGRDEQQPSPGNKAGGLTTILEKSLGAVAKGGTTILWTSTSTPSA
jgi:hypothetical protein